MFTDDCDYNPRAIKAEEECQRLQSSISDWHDKVLELTKALEESNEFRVLSNESLKRQLEEQRTTGAHCIKRLRIQISALNNALEESEKIRHAQDETIDRITAENKNLTVVLEDRLCSDSPEGNKTSASDVYWAIANELNVPEGGSVYETVLRLFSENEKLTQFMTAFEDGIGRGNAILKFKTYGTVNRTIVEYPGGDYYKADELDRFINILRERVFEATANCEGNYSYDRMTKQLNHLKDILFPSKVVEIKGEDDE